MKKRIFITATNTNIGKTYTTKLLLKEYAQRGYKVGVIKPIETGVVDEAQDAKELFRLTCKLNPEFKNLLLADIVPITYKLPAAPYVASNKHPLEMQKIDASIQKAEKYCDILLIEGAGGLLVPIDERYFMLDIALHVKASILLVSHCKLGCINDTLLNKKMLDDVGCDYVIAFNPKGNRRLFNEISLPYFKDILKEVLFVDENIALLSDKFI